MSKQAVLAHFAADVGERVGHGGEATVYALGDDRVLRLYHHQPHGGSAMMAAFYDEIDRGAVPFVVPQVLDHGEIDGTWYSIDRRIAGRPLMDVLPSLSGERRRRMLDAYLDGAHAIAALTIDREGYGEILLDDAIMADTWPAFLRARVAQILTISRPDLEGDVPDLDRALAGADRAIAALPVRPPRVLVHGDYFPGNVMVDEETLRVTGVIDFGPLTVMGDALLDVTSAVVFLEASRDSFERADSAYLTEALVRRYGDGIIDVMRTYRAYCALRLSHTKLDDDHLYAWCAASIAEMVE